MPNVRSSTELSNHYNEISAFCHSYSEPVFITNNGKDDLAVMSVEAYRQMMSRFELYSLLQEGLEDVRKGDTRPFEEVFSALRHRREAQ